MRALARRLLLVWFVSALVLTLAPFQPRAPVGFGWAAPPNPFELAANVALFVPMGVLAAAAGLRRRGALAAGLLVTLLIETSQMRLALRYPSYLDLVANAAGALLGALYAAPLWRLGLRLHDRRVGAAALVVGVAATIAMVARFPQIPHYAYAFPFALGVAGSLFASGIWTPPVACLLTAPAVIVTNAALWGPLDPGLALAAFAGAALGAWALVPLARRPAMRTAPATRA